MLQSLLAAAHPLLVPAFTAWGVPVTWIEIVAFVVSLWMVGCEMRVHPLAWPLAMLSSLMYALLFADSASSDPIGAVTSGGFGPSLNAPVAMGYVPSSRAAAETSVFAEVRGQRLPMRISPMPFVPNTYKR